MPYSSPLFDNAINAVIKKIKPKTCYDLGAGAGKYSELISKISPETKTVAIEIEKEYIEKFNLKSTYSKVLNISVMDLLTPKFYETNFDTVIIGDTIEHLKKSEGIDILNFLVYRCRWIIIQFPVRYLQNSVDNHTSEAHISVWGKSDFSVFEKSKLYAKQGQRLIVIRGYLEKTISLNQIDKAIEGNA